MAAGASASQPGSRTGRRAQTPQILPRSCQEVCHEHQPSAYAAPGSGFIFSRSQLRSSCFRNITTHHADGAVAGTPSFRSGVVAGTACGLPDVGRVDAKRPSENLDFLINLGSMTEGGNSSRKRLPFSHFRGTIFEDDSTVSARSSTPVPDNTQAEVKRMPAGYRRECQRKSGC